jgi:hypothetical protein
VEGGNGLVKLYIDADYCSFEYSALASLKIGMSESASHKESLGGSGLYSGRFLSLRIIPAVVALKRFLNVLQPASFFV